MPNRFQPIPQGTQPEQMIATINRNFGELDNESVKKIYSGSDGLPRIFIDGSSGVIKVAPSGIDVTTATNAQLNFNSAQKVFKIIDSGTRTVNKPASSSFVQETYSHGLSFVPALLCYASYDSGGGVTTYIPVPLYSLTDSGAGALNITRAIGANVDSAGVNMFISTPSSGGTFTSAYSVTFKYYLLQETAS